MEPSPRFTGLDAIIHCDRNIWCPRYDACLTAAARRNHQLDCGACPLSSDCINVFVLTMDEIIGCHRLLKEIFFYTGETSREA